MSSREEDLRVGRMSNREEDVRVGMSNLAISENAVDRQVELRLSAGVAAAQLRQYPAGVETPESEAAARRYYTLLLELVKEEQREYKEYAREMDRQNRLPNGYEQIERFPPRRLRNN